MIVRRYEPIFMTPSNSFGRAHFYSPLKKVGKRHVSTIYFNALVIWLISLILYISLIFDLVKLIKIGRLIYFAKRLKTKLFHKV